MSRSDGWQKLIPEAPCDRCHKRELCKREELACPAFSEYVSDSDPTFASGVPVKRVYDRIFSGVEYGT